MNGFVTNIEKLTEENENFRKVLYTARHIQLVVMSLLPHEDIGLEFHHLDQFIRVESGDGKSILDGVESSLTDGSAVIVPAGVEHNIVNTGDTPMKLYTVYGPPNHKDGTIHTTKEDAEKDEEEHFDGLATK
jgi:mannose-6-phosphate isomerase-like protein (cupin superfamily)